MREYYMLFPALKMTRHQLMQHVGSILGEQGISPAEASCEELLFEPSLQRYQWTGRTVPQTEVPDTLSRTSHWQGVALYFHYDVEDVLGDLSVLLWNDGAPGTTTLALCENSLLFDLQRRQARCWDALQHLLLCLVDSLRADFCLMQCEPTLRTLAEEDIARTLEQVVQQRLVPLFLSVRQERFAQAAGLQRLSASGYSVRRENANVIISSKQMGTAEEE